MNPNLEYGQAVRGINTGRGIGIIDTVSLIHVAQGVALLEQDGLLDAKVVDGVDRWFADYLHWMTTSQKGLDEKKSGNNHATWWPDGSCPREEARTQSLRYSAMNLDAFSVICRIAETNGVSLWKYRTLQGIGIETAFHYLMPFVEHPDTWREPQITKYSADSTIFPALAGVGLHDDRLLAAYLALGRASSPWVQFVDLAATAV